MPAAQDAEPLVAAERIARRDDARALDTVLLIVGADRAVAGRQLSSSATRRCRRRSRPSRKLAAIMSDEDFPRHAWETARAFFTALRDLARRRARRSGSCSARTGSPARSPSRSSTALYSIPKITLYPVILLLFGLGISAKIAFGVIHGIIPVILFTMNAVRNIRAVYLRSARAMRLTAGADRRDHHHSGRAAGDRLRLPHRLRADLARHADRRDVRLAARHRLHAGEGDGDRRHRNRDVARAAAGGAGDRRVRRTARSRPAPAPARNVMRIADDQEHD